MFFSHPLFFSHPFFPTIYIFSHPFPLYSFTLRFHELQPLTFSVSHIHFFFHFLSQYSWFVPHQFTYLLWLTPISSFPFFFTHLFFVIDLAEFSSNEWQFGSGRHSFAEVIIIDTDDDEDANVDDNANDDDDDDDDVDNNDDNHNRRWRNQRQSRGELWRCWREEKMAAAAIGDKLLKFVNEQMAAAAIGDEFVDDQ